MSTLNVNCTRSVMLNWLVLHYPNVVTFWLKVAFIIWLAFTVFPHRPHHSLGSLLVFLICQVSPCLPIYSHLGTLSLTHFRFVFWHHSEIILFCWHPMTSAFSVGTWAVLDNASLGRFLFTMLPTCCIPFGIFLLDWCPGLWTGFCYDDIFAISGCYICTNSFWISLFAL